MMQQNHFVQKFVITYVYGYQSNFWASKPQNINFYDKKGPDYPAPTAKDDKRFNFWASKLQNSNFYDKKGPGYPTPTAKDNKKC